MNCLFLLILLCCCQNHGGGNRGCGRDGWMEGRDGDRRDGCRNDRGRNDDCGRNDGCGRDDNRGRNDGCGREDNRGRNDGCGRDDNRGRNDGCGRNNDRGRGAREERAVCAGNAVRGDGSCPCQEMRDGFRVEPRRIDEFSAEACPCEGRRAESRAHTDVLPRPFPPFADGPMCGCDE